MTLQVQTGTAFSHKHLREPTSQRKEHTEDNQELPQNDKEKGSLLLKSYAERFNIPTEIHSQVNPELFYQAHALKLSPEKAKNAILAQDLKTLFEEASIESQNLLEQAFETAKICKQYFNNLNPILSLALYADIAPELLIDLYEENLSEIASRICAVNGLENDEDINTEEMKKLLKAIIVQAKKEELFVNYQEAIQAIISGH